MPKKNSASLNSWKAQMSSPSGDLSALVTEAVQQAAQQIQHNLAKQHLASIGDLMAAIASLKEVLLAKGVCSEAELLEARFSVEDKAWGLTSTLEPAQFGDFLRVTYKTKAVGTPDFGPEARENIPRLGQSAEIKEGVDALVGMRAGEFKEFQFEHEGVAHITHIQVNRVSKYPETQGDEQ